MTNQILRHISRRVRLISYTPLLWWLWRYRNDIRRALPMLGQAPSRLRARETVDLVVAAKVLHALATDARTHGDTTIQLCAVKDGAVHLRVAGTKRPHVVPVVERVAGVTKVTVSGPGAPDPTDDTHQFPLPAFA